MHNICGQTRQDCSQKAQYVGTMLIQRWTTVVHWQTRLDESLEMFADNIYHTHMLLALMEYTWQT